MEDTNLPISPFAAFTQKRSAKGNDVMEQAQRLVNLFRHAGVLGYTFPEQFDQMLLQASPAVLTALNDIIGGPTVRRYYDFLTGKTTPQSTDVDEDGSVEQRDDTHGGYLPPPEEDVPYQPVQTGGGQSPSVGDMAGLESILTRMADMHRLELDKQMAVMQQAFNRMIQAQTMTLASALKDRSSPANAPSRYSDIIEESSKPTDITDE